MRGDSEAGGDVEYQSFHNGDQVIASQGHVKATLGAGVALLGSITETDADAPSVRTPTGTFALKISMQMTWTGLAFGTVEDGTNVPFYTWGLQSQTYDSNGKLNVTEQRTSDAELDVAVDLERFPDVVFGHGQDHR